MCKFILMHCLAKIQLPTFERPDDDNQHPDFNELYGTSSDAKRKGKK